MTEVQHDLFDVPENDTGAWIQYMGLGNGLHALGFRQAGDALADEIERDATKRDVLIVPMAFCYRHYVELTLKDVLRAALAIDRGQPDDTIEKALGGHGLQRLWNLARPHILSLKSDWPSAEEISLIDKRLAEWDSWDPASFSFRYPLTKAGAPNVDATQVHIGVGNLRERMAKLAQVLDMMIDWLDMRWQAECEQRAEFEAEMHAMYGDIY